MPEIPLVAGAVAGAIVGVIAVLGVVVIFRFTAGGLFRIIDHVQSRRDAKVAEDRIRRLYEGRR